MEASQTNLLIGAAAFAVVVLIFALLIRKFARPITTKINPNWRAPEPPIEIARIEERTVFSLGGAAAGVLLVLHNFGMLFAFIGGAKSAVQEASLGTVWIAGNVLWGVCAIIGRRRTYRVLRDQSPAERVEPRA
jgi:membrane protein implicated in regulation of membrane protease activity